MPNSPRWSSATLVTTATAARSTPRPRRSSPPRAVSSTAASTSGRRSSSRAPLGPRVVALGERHAADAHAVGGRDGPTRQPRPARHGGEQPHHRGLAVGSGDERDRHVVHARSSRRRPGRAGRRPARRARRAPDADRDQVLTGEEGDVARAGGLTQRHERRVPLAPRSPRAGGATTAASGSAARPVELGARPSPRPPRSGRSRRRARRAARVSARLAPPANGADGERLPGPADGVEQAPGGGAPGGDRPVARRSSSWTSRMAPGPVEQQRRAGEPAGIGDGHGQAHATGSVGGLLARQPDAARVAHELAAAVVHQGRGRRERPARAGRPAAARPAAPAPRGGTG